MSSTEVLGALQDLAASLTEGGHHLQAIKAHTAILNLSLPVKDEAVTRLRLARLLLEHTHNITDARQQLQKADLLAARLQGQQLLRCEVLAQLGRAHQHLAEHAFQRAAYAKGLEAARESSAPSSSRRALHEWAIYFQLASADSHLSDRDTARAAECAAAGAALAAQHGMTEHQLLCLMFQLQLSLLDWDRQAAEGTIAEAERLMQQLKQAGKQVGGGSDTAFFTQLQLQFTMLQVVFSLHIGNFQELNGATTTAAAGAASQPPIISQMEGLLEALQQTGPPAYRWLPPPCLAALVQLLAASILKPTGKVKAALLHISQGLQLLDKQLASLQPVGGGPLVAESQLDHISTFQAQPCLVLKLLLLEARQQLHLLSSELAAARQDVAANIQLASAFPTLLAGLRPSVHLQAGLYAQAVGAVDAAIAHFNRVVNSSDSRLRVAARCLAALSLVSQATPESVAQGRELLAELQVIPESSLGYAERAVSHIAGGLLQLVAQGSTSDDRAEAKQRLSKALKLAHGRLQNHQLVSQILLFMTPLQVHSGDLSGGLQMVTSGFTLAKGAGDLSAQVASLAMMQQLFHHSKQADKAAQNFNYLSRKQEELSSKIQEAEAEPAAHQAALTWDL